MEETIIKAAILVSFIFCGYTLKQLRLFGRSTFNTISTIVFNITLPSVILVNLLAKTIFSSIPVLSYIIMITLSLAGFSLPQVVIDWAKIPASANTFLSMLMIGVALGLSLKKEYLHLIYTDVGLRLLTSVVIAAFVYFALDYPMAIKKVIMVLVFAPVAGMACYYTAKMKLKIEVAACISSFYILLSIVVMSAMIIALQSI